jgi:TPR repeat protein
VRRSRHPEVQAWGVPDGGILRSRPLLAVWLGLALAATAGNVSAASRDSDPYGWQDYTRQLRQEESRRIDRMLDNTYGPNARSTSPDLRPLANSLNNLFTSLAEAKRQRAEEKDAQARFLIELYRQRQQQAEEQARIAAEEHRQAQLARWAREWGELKESAQRGDGQAAAHVARFVRYGSPRLPKGTPVGEKEALPWLRLAADHGHAASAFDYGILMRASDPREALRYLTKAAEGGHLDAVPYAADMALDGAGVVAPDRAEALRILKLGLVRGHRASYVTAARFACMDPSATEVSFRQAAKWLTDAGPDPGADGLLAQLLFHGRPGVPVDVPRAVQLAERCLAASPRHAGAREVLGLAWLPDSSRRSRALDHLRGAAEEGSLAACRRLALAYRTGADGVAVSDAETRRWLEQAARRGDAESSLMLARLERERTVPEVGRAERWYEQASQDGSTEAAFEIALLWDRGRHGFPKSPEASHRHATRAALAGHSEAMELCAWQLLRGRGCEADPSGAARWMKLAAEKGLASAQHTFGLMALEGVGQPKDAALAFAWESRAAGQGDAEAAAQMAYLLATGTGCPQDFTQAREWARRSAAAGHPAGEVTYGLMLLRGDGGPADGAGAVPWLRKAHRQGDAQAALELGILHRQGSAGVESNPELARSLLEEAARSKDPTISDSARSELARLPTKPGGVSLDGLRIAPKPATSRLDKLRIP